MSCWKKENETAQTKSNKKTFNYKRIACEKQNPNKIYTNMKASPFVYLL